jgi:hypothetical protein
MGVQLTVTFPAGEPGWPAVAAKLAEAGEAPAVRMIDGLPAFPDEVPEDGWREVRVGFAAGMVTITRTASEWRCTVWGTADPALLRAQAACAWAAASAGSGLVHTDAGPLSPDAFRQQLK